MLVANIKIWKSHLNIREGSDYMTGCQKASLPSIFLGGGRFWLPVFTILTTCRPAHLCRRVRCTINRSHSTPCKKAEFEHLQIFPGHCLDFFLSVSGKICHSPIKKVKRQPTLIISFSQHSPFFGEQSKKPG